MKTIWILSGGGSRGCFQAGAMLSLDKRAKPDCVLGCSAGALNAAGYAFQGAEWVADMWRTIDSLFDAYRPSLRPWDGGIMEASPERALIRKAIPDGVLPMIECLVNYSDLLSDEELVGSAMNDRASDFRIAVEASTTIPALAPPVCGRFVDGGIHQMAPVSQAVALGAEHIIIISCFPLLPVTIKELYKPRTLGAAIRAIESALRKSLLKDIALCRSIAPGSKIEVIAPPVAWDSSPFDFSKEQTERGIALGVELAK